MLKPVQRIPSYRLLLIGELDFRGFVAFVADSVVMRGGSVFLPNFSSAAPLFSALPPKIKSTPPLIPSATQTSCYGKI